MTMAPNFEDMRETVVHVPARSDFKNNIQYILVNLQVQLSKNKRKLFIIIDRSYKACSPHSIRLTALMSHVSLNE